MDILTAFVAIQGLPLNGASSTVGLYAAVMLSLGLLISWAAPACNNPIFAEIVPPDLRNMIYAFDRSFEGAIAACGAPFVGWLAEYMGFKVSAPLLPQTGAVVNHIRVDPCCLVVLHFFKAFVGLGAKGAHEDWLATDCHSVAEAAG